MAGANGSEGHSGASHVSSSHRGKYLLLGHQDRRTPAKISGCIPPKQTNSQTPLH